MSPEKENTQKIESQPAGEPLPAQHPTVNDKAQSSRPAGEARGPIAPQGQGGPHPPAEPTGRSLSEQFEIGPPAEPAEPAHKCSICNGPDHRACGCEAKVKKSLPEIKKDRGAKAGSRMDQELDSEEVHVDDVLEKLFKETLNPIASDMAISVVETVEKFQDFQQSVLDGLTDINTNLEAQVKLQTEPEQEIAKSFDEYADLLDTRILHILDGISDINNNLKALVKLQTDRADLLKDIQNGKPNQT